MDRLSSLRCCILQTFWNLQTSIFADAGGMDGPIVVIGVLHITDMLEFTNKDICRRRRMDGRIVVFGVLHITEMQEFMSHITDMRESEAQR